MSVAVHSNPAAAAGITGRPVMVRRLKVDEAAKVARCHPQTLYKALESGECHGTQLVAGGRWKIREDCLDAWLDKRPCDHQSTVVQLKRGRP